MFSRHVPLEILFVTELFLAKRTHEFSDARVLNQVSFKIGGTSESFSAIVALITVLSSVFFHMELVSTFRRELSPAYIAAV